MVRNYVKIAWRNLVKNKSFSFINIAGLSVGMAASILILLWVQNELSFDRFHEKTNRISLLYSREYSNGKPEIWNHVAALMAPELKESNPAVEDAVRYNNVTFLVSVGENHFNLRGAFADPSFLSVFSFPLVEGNSKNALNANSNIVITQKLAKQLFGDQNPIGKVVKVENSDNFIVSGVLKNLPNNTEFNFEYLLPWNYMAKLGWDKNQTWAYTNSTTYVLLKQGASSASFDANIKNIVGKHLKEVEGAKRETFLQPLGRVHLYAKEENGNLVGGQIEMVRLFTITAIFILLVACINFMNLSTARSAKRAKEVGIRKAAGARRSALITQFLSESLAMTLISFAVALCIVKLSLNQFNQIIGIPLEINLDIKYWVSGVLFVLLTAFIAGSYPAFYLSSFKPVAVLKGTFKSQNTLVTPRKVLVILQFAIAVVLIACTLVIRQQIQYARNRDAGYSRNNLVYTFTQGDIGKHYDLIKNELISSGAAVSVTKTFSPITRMWANASGFTWSGSNTADKSTSFVQFEEDAGLTKTIGTKILQGRDIDINSYPTDSSAMLLNEAAVNAMHMRDPVGKTVQKDGRIWHIVGIIEDFIIESPYEEIKPMVIQGPSGGYGAMHFRLNPANTTERNLALAKQVFKKYNPEYPFDYYFADEAYASKFKAEQQENTLAAICAALTIFISCLGLFGLVAYMTEVRIKEIGVRKVLGASVTGIASMLSKDLIKLILIAIIIALPSAWFIMQNWLQKFNYRIHMNIWSFVLTALLVIVIAVLTVSYNAIRSAMANPIKSLRTE